MQDAVSTTDKNLVRLVYALQGLTFIFGFTGIVGVVINYLKSDSAKGTWLESHHKWQIRTFWWSLVWAVVAFLGNIFLMGWIIAGLGAIWYIYRFVKGWVRLGDELPMYI